MKEIKKYSSGQQSCFASAASILFIADTQNGEITSFTINVPADIQAA
jgi:hypothetical protein